MKVIDERRRFALMLDYEFGRGTSSALPKSGLEFFYSRKSDRLKQVNHEGRLFAIIRPNGAIALTLYSSSVLVSSAAFLGNSVTVSDEAVEFVRRGKSVFCKFVTKVGKHVLPGGEVVVLDGRGSPIGVGRAKVAGIYMREFKAGVAVKVRGNQL
ncbi:MAG: queuine tRNA-ribosyltransferase [Nitrososphaerota archaeon]|nr:queuine tRNA-ribosyltransferase [Nitrososphaerota archaeon]